MKDDPIRDRFPARMQIQIAETYLSVHPHPLHYAKADSTRATSARTPLPQPASMLCGDGNTWIGNVFVAAWGPAFSFHAGNLWKSWDQHQTWRVGAMSWWLLGFEIRNVCWHMRRVDICSCMRVLLHCEPPRSYLVSNSCCLEYVWWLDEANTQ